MDWEKARYLMVEQQIRPWDVLDQTVLQLLLDVKREDFVPASHRDVALVDVELPLPDGRKLWQPKLEARAVQDAHVKAGDRVLVIGSAVGYVAALLGKLAKHVYAVDTDAELCANAREALRAAGIHNVSVEAGDAVRGWAAHAPYDVIIATGSYPVRPDFLFEQLADGGRAFIIVGEEPAMTATRFVKLGSKVHEEKLFETVVQAFKGAPQPERFHF